MAHGEPSDETPVAAGPKEWLGLAVLAVPCLIYAMDLTVLHLAVPAIVAQLRPTASQMLWIVDIYGFMVAGFLIPLGTLGDRIGRRKLLMLGAAGFALASIAAAFAPTSHALIAARALQGIAGATLAPSTLSLITNMFRRRSERQIAIGIWVASFSGGAAIGPVFGGLILEHFWWGSVLLINAPLMLILILVGPFLLPEYKAEKAGRLDLVSAAMSLAAVLLVTFGMKRIAEHGVSWYDGAFIAAGVLVGALFVRRQNSLEDPMLDFSLFRIPGFAAALTVNIIGLFTILGTFFFIAQYLQLVLGMGPLEAGLWTAPGGAVFALGSIATPPLLQRWGPEKVITTGFLVAAAGFLLLSQISAHASPWLMLVAMLTFCAGLAPMGTTTTDIVMARSPPERAGATSAISETSFEFGGAAGIAVLGSIVTAIYQSRMAAVVPSQELSSDLLEVARNTLGGAEAVARTLTGETANRLRTASHEAFTHAMAVTGAIAAAASLAAAWFSRRYLKET